MEENKNVYTWTDDPTDEFWHNDRFETIEECIEDAKKQGKPIGSRIAVGTCEDYVPSIDIFDLLEKIVEDAYDECGEIADGFIEFKYGNHKNEEILQERMNKVLIDWLKETNQYPTFYKIQPLKYMYEVN